MKTVLLVVMTLVFAGCSEDNINKTEQKKEVVKKGVVEAAAVVTQVVEKVATAKTGEDLFIKCAACHGQNAEKAALGKSQVIKGWKTSKTTAALNGYKDGTYGGVMKGLMKGQVTGLSDEDIKTVSGYISEL